MMLVSSAVLAGLPKVSLEDEDEDEDEQRKTRMKMKDGNDGEDNYDEDDDDDDDEDEDNQQNKMKMKHDDGVHWTEEEFEDEDDDDDEDEDNQQNKMKMKLGDGGHWTEEEFEDEDDDDDEEDDEDDEDEDNQQNKMKMSSDKDGDWNFDTARMICNTDSKAIQPSIFNRIREKEVKSSVDQPKIIRAGKSTSQVTTYSETLKAKTSASDIIIKFRTQERKEGTDMDIFWCIVDALAQECNHGKFSDVRRRHEDQFFALIGETVSAANGQSISFNTYPMNNIAAMKSLGTECVNFSVTNSSLQNRAHRISSADASSRLRPEVDTGFCSPLWVLDDTGASFSLTEDLCIPLPPRHRPRGLAQHNLHRPRGLAQHNLHRHRPRGLAQLLRVLSPVWIYDTGASFSLTRDLSLLPGVCSTGDCSPFLGLRHADPVSAANGQSVVSNKCGRASGTLNLSRTAPQTTGLISSSEPIAADNSSLLTPDTTPEQTWRVASAAPQHMTGYLNHLIDYTPASGDQVIDTPNMGPLAVHGRGSVNTANITLQDVLYVPCLDANLVSTGQLAQLGYMITLGPYGCRIYKDDEDMPLVGEAHYVDGYLLELDFLRVRPSTN